jgi:hypothetical protein
MTDKHRPIRPTESVIFRESLAVALGVISDEIVNEVFQEFLAAAGVGGGFTLLEH